MPLPKICIAAALGLASTTLADFTWGTISGLQLDGAGGNPTQDTYDGHWLLGIDGADYSQADFCAAGALAQGDDPWTAINTDPNDPPNFCGIPIPGLPDEIQISNAAGVGGGDCGAGFNTGDRQQGDQIGALINTITSPNAAIGNCYYDLNCKYCINTGSQYAEAGFTCLSGSQGGVYGSGIEGVNADDSVSDC